MSRICLHLGHNGLDMDTGNVRKGKQKRWNSVGQKDSISDVLASQTYCVRKSYSYGTPQKGSHTHRALCTNELWGRSDAVRRYRR